MCTNSPGCIRPGASPSCGKLFLRTCSDVIRQCHELCLESSSGADVAGLASSRGPEVHGRDAAADATSPTTAIVYDDGRQQSSQQKHYGPYCELTSRILGLREAASMDFCRRCQSRE
jgi:hypothetical protein